MRTQTLTYRSYRPSVSQAVAHAFSQSSFRLNISYILLAVCGGIALMYASNLYSVISTTVAIQRIQTESRALTSAVESLDSQYLSLSSQVTPDVLKSYGLKKGEVSFFIPRSNGIGRVAIRGHEL